MIEGQWCARFAWAPEYQKTRKKIKSWRIALDHVEGITWEMKVLVLGDWILYTHTDLAYWVECCARDYEVTLCRWRWWMTWLLQWIGNLTFLLHLGVMTGQVFIQRLNPPLLYSRSSTPMLEHRSSYTHGCGHHEMSDYRQGVSFLRPSTSARNISYI